MGHGANATKANAPSLDGSSRSRHTYCGLFRATVDAQVGQDTARQAPCPAQRPHAAIVSGLSSLLR